MMVALLNNSFHEQSDNYIFIHINKTGGSSIEKALNLKFEHNTALEKIEEMGRKQWDKKFTFTVIRNPWDKVVSHYHYRVQTNQTNLGVNTIDFHEWVKLSYGEKDPRYYDKPKMFMPQIDWIADQEGEILVDYICRFENIQSDFDSVCERLNRGPFILPHLKRTGRLNYKHYYDEATMETIHNWFYKDIEMFKYRY